MWVLISQRDVVWKYGLRCDLLENNYVRFFQKHGLELIPVSNVAANIHRHAGGSDPPAGIVLSGGNDISPALYGEEARESLDVSMERDRTEKELMALALKEKIPLLGICRGMQFINVFFGGKLVRDGGSDQQETPSGQRSHEIEITHRGLIDRLKEKRVSVNSFHDQAVSLETLAAPLTPFALDTQTGAVEGLYHPGEYVVGVQFHPEREGTLEGLSALMMEAFVHRTIFWN